MRTHDNRRTSAVPGEGKVLATAALTAWTSGNGRELPSLLCDLYGECCSGWRSVFSRSSLSGCSCCSNCTTRSPRRSNGLRWLPSKVWMEPNEVKKPEGRRSWLSGCAAGPSPCRNRCGAGRKLAGRPPRRGLVERVADRPDEGENDEREDTHDDKSKNAGRALGYAELFSVGAVVRARPRAQALDWRTSSRFRYAVSPRPSTVRCAHAVREIVIPSVDAGCSVSNAPGP